MGEALQVASQEIRALAVSASDLMWTGAFSRARQVCFDFASQHSQLTDEVTPFVALSHYLEGDLDQAARLLQAACPSHGEGRFVKENLLKIVNGIELQAIYAPEPHMQKLLGLILFEQETGGSSWHKAHRLLRENTADSLQRAVLLFEELRCPGFLAVAAERLAGYSDTESEQKEWLLRAFHGYRRSGDGAATTRVQMQIRTVGSRPTDRVSDLWLHQTQKDLLSKTASMRTDIQSQLEHQLVHQIGVLDSQALRGIEELEQSIITLLESSRSHFVFEQHISDMVSKSQRALAGLAGTKRLARLCELVVEFLETDFVYIFSEDNVLFSTGDSQFVERFKRLTKDTVVPAEGIVLETVGISERRETQATLIGRFLVAPAPTGSAAYIATGKSSQGRLTSKDLIVLRLLADKMQLASTSPRKPQPSGEHSTRYTFDSLIGDSLAMNKVMALADAASRSDANVLITGESGTGKEVVAQSIHAESYRSTGPFLAMNCAAIPRELIESELFGYEPGSFTGAGKDGRAGIFERAKGGTVLLDEIGDMPLDMQAKLLRVLQERTCVRIGGSKTIHLDCRIMATTHQDLANAVAEKKFRQDLFFRLRVIHLEIPALRNRKQDIERLAMHFLKKFSTRENKTLEQFADAVRHQLATHSWPGNVRELEHVIEAAVSLAPAGEQALRVLPHLQVVRQKRSTAPPTQEQVLISALKEARGNVQRAAGLLDVSRGTLYNKMRKFGIDPANYRGVRRG